MHDFEYAEEKKEKNKNSNEYSNNKFDMQTFMVNKNNKNEIT